MSNLLKRVLTAIIAGGAVVGGIIAHEAGAFVFCAVVSTLGWVELMKISGNDSRVLKGGGILLCIFTWLVLLILPNLAPLVLWLGFLPGFAVLMLWEKEVKSPMRNAGSAMLGLVYVFIPFVLLYLISRDWTVYMGNPFWGFQHSLSAKLFLSDIYIGGDTELAPHVADRLSVLGQKFARGWTDYPPLGNSEGFVPGGNGGYDFRTPLGILLLTWTTDSMAYFGGKYLGKRKLFERISPKKTWEGTIIGALCCIGLGILFYKVWPGRWNWIVVATIIAIFTQLGDLVESMFKRSLHIKDSGGLLPGHGGILDRFDGMLITLPIIFFYDLIKILV